MIAAERTEAPEADLGAQEFTNTVVARREELFAELPHDVQELMETGQSATASIQHTLTTSDADLPSAAGQIMDGLQQEGSRLRHAGYLDMWGDKWACVAVKGREAVVYVVSENDEAATTIDTYEFEAAA